ncbi:hypothetical protein [Chitinophaga sp.]|uniref:hypothetical protein n=1 Tax=Chitinophaga sp. TaxID=1869181 RepID=UPI002F95349C
MIAFAAAGPGFNMDESIDWAIEQLQLGHETPHLLMLAGMSKPVNYFETAPYLAKALEELHLEEKRGEEAIVSFCGYHIKKIARGQDVFRNLTQLYPYYYQFDMDDLIHDFVYLYWAWTDLDYDGGQYYLPGATADNIQGLVVERAVLWLAENQ